MKLVIALAGIIAILILGFIAWLTGGSFMAFLAGVLFLGLAGVLVAKVSGILTLPGMVQSIISVAMALCVGVILWAGVSNWWEERKHAQSQQVETPATHTPAIVRVVRQDPNRPSCETPCDLTFYGLFDLKSPSARLEVDAPLEDGKRHTFLFDSKGKFEKPSDEKIWADNVHGGKFYFDTPGNPGLPVTIVLKGQ